MSFAYKSKVGSGSTVKNRCGFGGGNTLRKVVQPVTLGHNVLGHRTLPTIVAKAVCPDGVAHRELGDARANVGNHAHGIATHDERKLQGRLVRSRKDVAIDVVCFASNEAHQDVTSAKDRQWYFFCRDFFGSAVVVNHGGEHLVARPRRSLSPAVNCGLHRCPLLRY